MQISKSQIPNYKQLKLFSNITYRYVSISSSLSRHLVQYKINVRRIYFDSL